MILSPADLDRLISRAPLYMFVGFALIASEWLFGIGIISAFGLLSIASLLASISKYRSERGLWMLALLYGIAFFIVLFVSEASILRDALHGAQRDSWLDIIDMAIALRCQWLIVRAMASVFVHNRRLGKPAA